MTAIANVTTVRFGTAVQLTIDMLLYFGYAMLSHRSFYRRGFGSALRTFLAFALSAVVFIVSLAGIFMVTLIVHVLMIKASAGV